MSTIAAKEVVVTWDGEPSTWGDYARKVRFQWEKTPRHKRSLLGPDLASRLTGRAWAVTPSLDHARLNKRNGAKYLLRYLQERLCRTAVPDAGARLEDLLIRMRRPLGMSMSQWANEVLENYRRLQRAMVRARNQWRSKQKTTSTVVPGVSSWRSRSEPQAEPPSPMRRPPSTPASPVTRDGTSLRQDFMGKLIMEKVDVMQNPATILLKNLQPKNGKMLIRNLNGLMKIGENGAAIRDTMKSLPQEKICHGMS